MTKSDRHPPVYTLASVIFILALFFKYMLKGAMSQAKLYCGNKLFYISFLTT